MTRLFEVTQTGLVEQRQSASTGFHLPPESVSWFVIRRDGPAGDIMREGLPFDDATLAWISTPEQRPTFRMKGNLGLVDFALYNAAYDERPEYVRIVIGLEWRYGYFAALSVMLLITAFSLRYFARHGWFK